MIPQMSLSTSASSSAKGGEQGVTNHAISQGDWNVNTGSGSTGFSMKYLAIAAAVGAVLWLIKKKSA